MAKYIIYNSLTEAQAAQLIFDKKLGYRDENGNANYYTLHAFDIIIHPILDKWAIRLNPVSGMCKGHIDFKGKQLPLEALSGKKIIKDIVGNVTVKTHGQMSQEEWFVDYDNGEPLAY